MNFSRVLGTGSYLPENVVTNSDLEQKVDTSDEWIRTRTGISQRNIVSEGQSTGDLAVHAANRAIENAGIDLSDIDLLVVATATPDQTFPSLACSVQERLGIAGSPAFDVHAVCSGFIYGLDIADRFIRTGGASTALIIGSETFSRIVDWNDRSTCVLFGDGAGAMVIQGSESPGIHCSSIHADGNYSDLMKVPLGKYIEMSGGEMFKIAVKCLSDVSLEALEDSGEQVDSIDWVVPHQANFRILNAFARRMRLPLEKVIITIDTHANTSAASIPLAFDSAVQAGKLKRGQKVLLNAFGAGVTWGATFLTY